MNEAGKDTWYEKQQSRWNPFTKSEAIICRDDLRRMNGAATAVIRFQDGQWVVIDKDCHEVFKSWSEYDLAMYDPAI